MKKTLSILSLLLLSVFLLSSCSDFLASSKIVGVYQFSNVEIDPGSSGLKEEEMTRLKESFNKDNSSIEFKSDGTCIPTDASGSDIQWTYTYKSGKLTIMDQNKAPLENSGAGFTSYSLKDDTIQFVSTFDGATVTLSFTKKP